MHTILLHCHSEDNAIETRGTLEANLPHRLEHSFDSHETMNMISERIFHFFIFDCLLFTIDEFEFIKAVRKKGYSGSVLVLAHDCKVPNLDELRTNNRIHLLNKPFREKDILGITRKLLQLRQIPQQTHRRYRTDQQAKVETLIHGEILNSHIYNLSKGGAYAEYDQKTVVSIGDLVRVNVNNNDASKKHNLNAKVVWTTRKGRFSGRCGIGMKFISQEDVYRSLVEKV